MMDTKFKINFGSNDWENNFAEKVLSVEKDMPVLEQTFGHFLMREKLIKGFSFNGLLELEVFIVSDHEIREINNEYRKLDKSTDVISLSMFDDFREEWVENKLPIVNLGDVFISMDTAKKQALENNISLKEEIFELLIHGILHLLGFDHEKSNKELELMYKKEREIYDYFSGNCE
tara:strand:- start:13766 stop:14290 length:525 start_codon:yes stop_codon:yes gene_type:complete